MGAPTDHIRGCHAVTADLVRKSSDGVPKSRTCDGGPWKGCHVEGIHTHFRHPLLLWTYV